jgi:hypothetical protein
MCQANGTFPLLLILCKVQRTCVKSLVFSDMDYAFPNLFLNNNGTVYFNLQCMCFTNAFFEILHLLMVLMFNDPGTGLL